VLSGLSYQPSRHLSLLQSSKQQLRENLHASVVPQEQLLLPSCAVTLYLEKANRRRRKIYARQDEVVRLGFAISLCVLVHHHQELAFLLLTYALRPLSFYAT
jgi:hypothetical protein